ncbi:unnamed protein product [Ilex paraguariensis]|uniref:Uncharacterized protein n=1 Tax=Ilex paraguariensis TaxID=185542 RepID=A0ABC8SX45_9AQUA
MACHSCGRRRLKISNWDTMSKFKRRRTASVYCLWLVVQVDFFDEEARRSCGWCRLNGSGRENVRRRLWGRNFRAGWGERM